MIKGHACSFPYANTHVYAHRMRKKKRKKKSSINVFSLIYTNLELWKFYMKLNILDHVLGTSQFDQDLSRKHFTYITFKETKKNLGRYDFQNYLFICIHLAVAITERIIHIRRMSEILNKTCKGYRVLRQKLEKSRFSFCCKGGSYVRWKRTTVHLSIVPLLLM